MVHDDIGNTAGELGARFTNPRLAGAVEQEVGLSRKHLPLTKVVSVRAEGEVNNSSVIG